MKRVLQKGNSKISKRVLCFSLPPVQTCRNCTECKGTCFAVPIYNTFKSVRKSWDSNLALSKGNMFVNRCIKEIGDYGQCKAVRIHVSGDFYSQEYIDKWYSIAKVFAHIRFYAYTQVVDLDFSKLSGLENVNIISSIAKDGGLNYGGPKRVESLKKQGYKICPDYDGPECGTRCKYCWCHQDVAFLAKGHGENGKKAWDFLARVFPWGSRYRHSFFHTAVLSYNLQYAPISEIKNRLVLSKFAERSTPRACPCWTFQGWETISQGNSKEQMIELKNSIV